MTLEDFFTLTEMKGGLTAPSRVKELLCVMQKEQDYVVKNASDASRQWTAVASTIAATENKECLDLFIQLDGLVFIDKWLKDAQTVNKNTTDDFVDESIIALLRALEKLKLDNERLLSSGIWITIKNLIEHPSMKIQDGARALFESWKVEDTSGRNCLDVEQDTHDRGTVETGKPASESYKLDCSTPSAEHFSPKSCPREEVGDDQIQTSGEILSVADVKNESHGLPSPMHELNPNDKESPSVPSEKFALAACGNSVSQQDTRSGEIAELGNKLSQERFSEAELSSSCNAHEAGVASSDLYGGTSLVATTKEENEKNNKAILNPCTSQILKTQDSPCSTDALQKSSSKENNSKNSEGILFSVMEDIRATDEEEHSSDGSENLAIFRFREDDKGSSAAELTKSSIELEYGIVDAIQVARQVAQEVEREVVDNKEPSCSSSDGDSEGGFRQPTSPQSLKGRYDFSSRSKDVLSKRNNSSVSSSEEDGSLIKSKIVSAEKETGIQDMESSQLTEATLGPGHKVEKGLFVFDLNQEVSSDDMDFHANHVSVPIPHVSGSEPAAISGSPGAPMLLGGTAANVPHPGSPQRAAGEDKPASTEETQFGSRATRNCLDIDLNATEGGDDALIQAQIPGSSGLRSAESSVEVSSKRSGRLKLDLNRIDDSEQLISNSRVERWPLLHLNGHSSPSPSSSASSMQATKRNFDLNDRPPFQNDYSDRGLHSGKSSEPVLPLGKPIADPVISLFGTKVEVNRKDSISHSMPLVNGKTAEAAADASMAKAGGFLGMGSTMSYPHTPVWGYNGLAAGGTMPFAPAVYQPGSSLPYMVDPAGTPVLHQGVGSFMPVLPSHSQPPFMMSMGRGPLTLNGSIPPRPQFDLNSVFSIDGGSREPGVLRQFFVPDHGRSMEEHWRASSQLSPGYGVGNKRKEPEGGFDFYPINFRQQQPPWK